MPTSYSWFVVGPPLTGSAPNPGPGVPGKPLFKDIRKTQFERGIKFGNVPGGKPDNITHGGTRIFHINTTQNVLQTPSDKFDFSGVIKFRDRKRSSYKVPPKVSPKEFRQNDRFGYEIFPGTGQYPPGHVFFSFDPGAFHLTSSLVHRQSRYAGDMLLDRRIILAGGLNGDSIASYMSGAQIWHSASGWSPLPDMPTAKAHCFGLNVTGSNDFVVVGGFGATALEERRSYRWSATASLWLSTIPLTIVPRKHFQMVRLQDGRMFMPGGTGMISGTIPFTGSEIYDPVTNTVTGAAALPFEPQNREGYSLTTLHDGTVLLLGGHDPATLEPNDHAFRFYPNSGTFGTWVVQPSMSFPRTGHRAHIIRDGRVVVAGGCTNDMEESVPLEFPFGPGNSFGTDLAWDSAEMYLPETSQFFVMPSSSFRRSHFGIAGYLSDERIMMVGGQNTGSLVTGGEMFDQDGIWAKAAPSTFGSCNAMLFLIDSDTAFKFLMPGGDASGSYPSPLSQSIFFQTGG